MSTQPKRKEAASTTRSRAPKRNQKDKEPVLEPAGPPPDAVPPPDAGLPDVRVVTPVATQGAVRGAGIDVP
jgi:hypothetical protein